jgi:nitroreductase
LPLILNAVRRPHGWFLQQWHWVVHEDEISLLVSSLSKSD